MSNEHKPTPSSALALQAESIGDETLLNALGVRERLHENLADPNLHQEYMARDDTTEALRQTNEYISRRKYFLAPHRQAAGDDNEFFRHLVRVDELRTISENDDENRTIALVLREQAGRKLSAYLDRKYSQSGQQ